MCINNFIIDLLYISVCIICLYYIYMCVCVCVCVCLYYILHYIYITGLVDRVFVNGPGDWSLIPGGVIAKNQKIVYNICGAFNKFPDCFCTGI